MQDCLLLMSKIEKAKVKRQKAKVVAD